MTEINLEELKKLFIEINEGLKDGTAEEFHLASIKLDHLAGTLAWMSGYLTGLSDAKQKVEDVLEGGKWNG